MLIGVENNFAWALDADIPNQRTIRGGNIEQVYSYANHPKNKE